MQVQNMTKDMLYRFFFKETYLGAERFAERIKVEVVRQPENLKNAQDTISAH